jgi:hypothetical protein
MAVDQNLLAEPGVPVDCRAGLVAAAWMMARRRRLWGLPTVMSLVVARRVSSRLVARFGRGRMVVARMVSRRRGGLWT